MTDAYHEKLHHNILEESKTKQNKKIDYGDIGVYKVTFRYVFSNINLIKESKYINK